MYLLDMLDLPDSIRREFKTGKFAIRQMPGRFNDTWSDMAVVKTVIKDSKCPGGIIGMTRKKAAVVRWSLTRHLLGAYSSVMKSRSGPIRGDNQQHEEALPAAMKRDKDHLNALKSHLNDKMTDPFSGL